jgi:hypothetical protein
MELKSNQAALILTTDDDGEITVDIASPDHDGLSSAICQALAHKLMNDQAFQAELMDMLEIDDEE